jgi:hypothetical protein
MSSPEEFFLADLSSAFVLLSGASGVSMSAIFAACCYTAMVCLCLMLSAILYADEAEAKCISEIFEKCMQNGVNRISELFVAAPFKCVRSYALCRLLQLFFNDADPPNHLLCTIL